MPCSTDSCGIHSVSVSPGGEYVATGGQNPNYLAVYSLPHILPFALGEVSENTHYYSLFTYLLNISTLI